MNRLLALTILMVFILTSCGTTGSSVNFNYPQSGNTNNVAIAAKDFTSLGIIFVKSTEVIDSDGSHTGSKITYEMLMLEARRLNADDVINIRIDVNQVQETVKGSNGLDITRITYNYTASALAIRYTTAITSGASSIRDTGSSISMTNNNTPPRRSNVRRGLVIGGVSVGIVVLGIIAVAALTEGSNDPYYY